MIAIDGHDIVALYLFLRAHELELDNRMVALLERLERILHSRLSIEQMENIEKLYENNTDILH